VTRARKERELAELAHGMSDGALDVLLEVADAGDSLEMGGSPTAAWEGSLRHIAGALVDVARMMHIRKPRARRGLQ
jgi:hypothetical protein